MPLNDGTVYIEKPDGICSLTFVADDFSGSFLHPSIFGNKDLHKLQMVLYQIYDSDQTLTF